MAPTEFVNVTKEIFSSLQHINDGKVVKPPTFDLLEGTRAVEVTNPKLDTSLIPLTEAEISFDPTKPQSADEVVAIMDKLLVEIMTWLNGSTLSVTVLSCRYVQSLLENYFANGGIIASATFQIPRLKILSYDTQSVEYKLVNLVLRGYVIGMCSFIGSSISNCQNALYEEEDLTTRALELDFLSNVPYKSAIVETDHAISYLLQNKVEKSEVLMKYLQLAKNLALLNSVLSISIDIFHEHDEKSTKSQLSFIDESLTSIAELRKEEPKKVPDGSFSKFIQLDRSNSNIPSDLKCMPRQEAYDSLDNLLVEVKSHVSKFSKVKNINQLHNFLQYDVAYAINDTYNVLIRGIFQLFLVRDDKSIVGSTREDLSTITSKFLQNITCLNTSLFDPETWKSIPGPEGEVAQTKHNIKEQIDILVKDIETGMYRYLSTFAYNRCRQRQAMNQAVLVWDTLQVELESLELGLWQRYKIGDKLFDGNGEEMQEASLTLACAIYYLKLTVMTEIALSGFELDLYKPFEFDQMFWYISYLSQLVVEHLSSRVNHIYELKIHYITHTLPNKVKKLKGEKKQALKQAFQVQQSQVLPQLQDMKKYSDEFVIPGYEALYLLSDAVRMTFTLLNAMGMIKGPPTKHTSEEYLYYLRMKPWSSVGAPALPSFEQCKSALLTKFFHSTNRDEKVLKYKQVISVISKKLPQAKQLYENIVKVIENSDFAVDKKPMLEWYNSLIKTCVWYTVKMKQLSSMDESEYKLVIGEGYHRYFPKVDFEKIEEKK